MLLKPIVLSNEAEAKLGSFNLKNSFGRFSSLY